MRIGHAILVYGYPALTRLQLAAAAEHWRPAAAGVELLTLVWHDGPADHGNRAVARGWGADFGHGGRWYGHRGILAGWADAVRWGAERGVEVLVIHARRWVPLWDVAAAAAALAADGTAGAATYGSPHDQGGATGLLRNEMAAVRPRPWVDRGADAALERTLALGPTSSGANCIQEVYYAAAVAAGLWADPRTAGRVLPFKGPVFTPWPAAIGPNRYEGPPNRTLWHYYSTPADYLAAARALGMAGVTEADFDVADRTGRPNPYPPPLEHRR